MKEGVRKLSKYRLSRARIAWKEGLVLFEDSFFVGAVNRFYYAAFYAARALLASKELDSSKHSGVIALFHKHFVRTHLFDIDKAKALSRSFEFRQDSDYEDFVSLTRHETATLKAQVEVFIDECERNLKQSSRGIKKGKKEDYLTAREIDKLF